jgi:hypothetical protein
MTRSGTGIPPEGTEAHKNYVERLQAQYQLNNITAGAAFPNPLTNGMTLLDYFAGQVIQGILSGRTIYTGILPKPHKSYVQEIVDFAYAVAEKMVAEKFKRERGGS